MADTDTATAPPQAPVQPESGPDLTAMIPYQGMPETASVTAPEPQPIQPESGPALTQTIPSETPPNNPDIERKYHEQNHRDILGRIASTMTSDETWHIHKDPVTGETTATQDPSTTKEKWGRIAALALGGAAAGLANAQGPGGLARATAAGIQTGLEQPQKTQQNVQQQVDFDNKQLLGRATRIHLNQQTYLASQQAKAEDLKLDQDSVDSLNKWYSATTSAGGKDLGAMDPTSNKEPMAMANAHPEAKDAFLGNGDKKIVLMRGPDHQVHAILTDKTLEEQPIDRTMPGFYIGAGADGKAALLTKDVLPGQATFGDLSDHNLVTVTKWNTARKTAADADKAEADANKPAAQPKDWQEAYTQASAATDPAEKKRLNDVGDQLYRKAQGLRTINQIGVGATPPGTNPADMIKPGGAFGPQTVNGETAEGLASGDILLGDLPKRLGKGSATPQEFFAAANEKSKELYGLGYSPTMIDTEKKQFESLKVQGILDGIDKMKGVGAQPGYLDTVVRLGQQAVGANSSAPWNTISLAVRKKFGEQAAKNFNTALGEVQRSLPSLIGNPLLGGSDSDLKQRMAQSMFGEDVTAGNLLSTAGTLNGLLQGSADSLTRNNRFLQRRYGLRGNYTAQFTPTQPGGGGTAPQQQQPQQQQQQGPVTAGPDFQSMQPPANEPKQAGRFYGKGPKGVGWYR